MHSQVLACTDLTGRAVANHENLAGLQPGSFLNFAESRFLGEHVAAISVINFFDGWLTVQAKRLHLGALDLRLTEADDEVSDTPSGQRAQERQRPRKRFKPAYRAVEVGFTRGKADGLRVFRAEVPRYLSIDITQHGIIAEGAHACAINSVCIGLDSRFHHGLRGVAVGGGHALPQAIIERVIQVKDHATDDGLIGAASAQFRAVRAACVSLLFLFLSGQRHLSGYCDIHSNHCYNSNMEAKLLHIPWMVSVLYGSIPLFWFAIHPFADSWRNMRRSPYLLLLPIWTLIIFVLGWITWPWRLTQFYSTLWAWAPAVLLFSFGIRTYAGIASGFGGHKLSGEAELRPREHAQELVTTGLHARMRHPIYIAHLLNLGGWAVGSGLMVSYVLLAVSAFFTFPLMIWMEEQELEKRFGQSFREYKARVPIVPLPFQRVYEQG
jgi:protein-S-isoprenylcysteine O-methyltransferase Ste14